MVQLKGFLGFCAALMLAAPLHAADVKVSALPAASALNGADTVPVVQSATTKKATVAQIVAAVQADSGTPELIRDTMGAALVAGSNVTLTVNDAADTITIAAAGGGGGGSSVDMHPGYVSGRKYPMDSFARTNGTMSTDSLAMVPFRVHKDITLTGLAVRVITGAASTAIKVGIYANVAGAPSASGPLGQVTLDTSTSASTPSSAFGSPLTLTKGLYWMVAVGNGAPTLVATATTDQLIPLLAGYDELTVAANSGMSSIQNVTNNGYATGLPSGAFPSMRGGVLPFPIIDLIAQ